MPPMEHLVAMLEQRRTDLSGLCGIFAKRREISPLDPLRLGTSFKRLTRERRGAFLRLTYTDMLSAADGHIFTRETRHAKAAT